MAELFERLADYFRFPFVRYALIVGVLIALCASLLGVTLVLKRFSFIGDGLSHVAFLLVSESLSGRISRPQCIQAAGNRREIRDAEKRVYGP